MARSQYRKLVLLLLFVANAMAQFSNDPQTTVSSLISTPTATPPSPPPPSSPEDDSDSTDDPGKQATSDLDKYYFVFLALLLVAAVGLAFYLWKRKRKPRAATTRATALERDVNTWDPARARRQYWRGGRSRSTDAEEGREEEGLDELGEAPPPYVPKPRGVEAGEEQQQEQQQREPAVPLVTLSREQAGLKPPDYIEVEVHETRSESVGRASEDSVYGVYRPHREN